MSRKSTCSERDNNRNSTAHKNAAAPVPPKNRYAAIKSLMDSLSKKKYRYKTQVYKL